jgi:tubulin---tyrosine ligase
MTPTQKPYNGFEIMGFDYMLDEDLNLTLIEVNTNPCLDTPCLLLQRILPQMLD